MSENIGNDMNLPALKDVDEFLAYAICLEQEAAERFADLSENMKNYGNEEVATFFGKMAHYSRMHLKEARDRAQFHELPDIPRDMFAWPDGESPESASMEGSHYLMDVEYALKLALEAEKQGFAFYDGIAKTTQDPEIRMMAEEFAKEEAEHIVWLTEWAQRYEAA